MKTFGIAFECVCVCVFLHFSLNVGSVFPSITLRLDLTVFSKYFCYVICKMSPHDQESSVIM